MKIVKRILFCFLVGTVVLGARLTMAQACANSAPTLLSFGVRNDVVYGRVITAVLLLDDGEVIEDYELMQILNEDAAGWLPGRWQDNFTGPHQEGCLSQLGRFSDYSIGALDNGRLPFVYGDAGLAGFNELLLQEATPPIFVPFVVRW